MRWLILLLLFLSSSVNAQIHFPDSAAQWVYYYSTHAWEPEWAQHSNHRYFLSGDTILENETYSTVSYEHHPIGLTPNQSNVAIAGFLKIQASKVYYKHLQWFDGLV